MKFELCEFEIHAVDGMAHARYVIKTDKRKIERDEKLRTESREDISLLRSIEIFIRSKDVK